jgi:hypothetical protein
MVAHAKALNKVSLMEAHAQQQRLDHSTAALRLYVSRLWIFCTLLTFSLWRHLLFGCLATRSKCSKMDMTRQHQSSTMKKVLSELLRLGFKVERAKSGVYKIVPPSTIQGPMYTTHGTESALHPMRRDFKRLYNVNLPV